MLRFVSLQQNEVYYLQVMEKEEHFDRNSYTIYLHIHKSLKHAGQCPAHCILANVFLR